MRLVVLLAALSAASWRVSAALTCMDESGNPVSWWFAYKVRKNKLVLTPSYQMVCGIHIEMQTTTAAATLFLCLGRR